MQGIERTIEITDKMTAPLMNMLGGVNLLMDAFDRVQGISSNLIQTGGIVAAGIEINEIGKSLIKMEGAAKASQGVMSGLASKVTEVAKNYLSIDSVKQIAKLSDHVVQTTAKLNLMNDGYQTTQELQDKIFQSSQRSRTSVADTTNLVVGLGQSAGGVFGSNDETILFAENLNKQFAMAGATQEDMVSASSQLTQALGSGAISGGELNAIFASAPNVLETIGNYLGVSSDKLRSMGADGEISAESIKNAMLSATDEINTQFDGMPKTFGQIGVQIKNHALNAFSPILHQVNEIANSEPFQAMVTGILSVLTVLGDIATQVFQVIAGMGSLIADNWSVIEPIVSGVAAAFLVYASYLAVTKGIELLCAGATKALAFGKALLAIATILCGRVTEEATTQQLKLNSAMYANPITWIVILIAALIGIIVAVCVAIAKWTDVANTGFGVISGCFMVIFSVIQNVLYGLLEIVFGVLGGMINPFIDIANFIGNVFQNPISSIIYLFQGMADTVLGILESIASAIDFLTGGNLAGTVSKWRVDLKTTADELVNKYAPDENYETLLSKIDLSVKDFGVDRSGYGDAWSKGTAWGDEMSEKLKGLGSLSDQGSPFGRDELLENTAKTAQNTERSASTLDITSEELKYLRDVAEQETINRFTTAEIVVNSPVNATINNGMDIDGIVGHLSRGLNDAMEIAAEGVHV